MLVQKRDTVRGIIIAHRVLMFMALSNLCPKIYILTNVYASIEIIFIKIIKSATNEICPQEPGKCWLSTNIDHE